MLAALFVNFAQSGNVLDTHDGDIHKHQLEKWIKRFRRVDYKSERERIGLFRSELQRAYEVLSDKPSVRQELKKAISSSPEQPISFEIVARNEAAVEKLLEIYMLWLDEQDVELLLMVS